MNMGLLFLLFVLVVCFMLFGFVLGNACETHQMRVEAIKHGCARYVQEEETGTNMIFQWNNEIEEEKNER